MAGEESRCSRRSEYPTYTMDDSTYWRTELTTLVNKVPASINGASINTVRQYKATVEDARKALASRNTSAMKLSELTRHLKSF